MPSISDTKMSTTDNGEHIKPGDSRFFRSTSTSIPRNVINNHNRQRTGSLCYPPPKDLEIPIDRTQFSAAVDVDGKNNYLRRNSQLYGTPYDVSSRSSRSSLKSHHTNAGFIADSIEDIEDDDEDKFDEMNSVSLKMDTYQERRKSSLNDDSQVNIKNLSIDDGSDLLTSYQRFQQNRSFYLKYFILMVYNVYLAYAIYRTWSKVNSCCDGVRFLTIVTFIAYTWIVYTMILRKWLFLPLILSSRKLWTNCVQKIIGVSSEGSVQIFQLLLVIIMAIYVLTICYGEQHRLIAILGIAFLIGSSYLLSVNRRQIRWSTVTGGLIIQFALANLVLKTDIGKSTLACLSSKIVHFLSFTDFGSRFVFGYLSSGEMPGVLARVTVFAFKALPVIIFFSFVVAILYHYGIMQFVVTRLGWLLQVTLGTTCCESLTAAGNIFLGMTESPLLVKPYLELMTKSELFAVLTSGFATIAGTVLVTFIEFGVDSDYLLSASVMAAPASLAVAKLFYPETELSRTKVDDIKLDTGDAKNALEAGANGASQAVKLCSSIVANLIAMLAFLEFLNFLLKSTGQMIDIDGLGFEWLLSQVFTPLAWLMGVEWKDCPQVGELLGLKIFANEFIAYQRLAEWKKHEKLAKRSISIATFALCGFANISSIGMQLGALGTMVPSRRSDLVSMSVRAMIAGSTVTFISACMAGLLIDDPITESLVRPFLNESLIN